MYYKFIIFHMDIGSVAKIIAKSNLFKHSYAFLSQE